MKNWVKTLKYQISKEDIKLCPLLYDFIEKFKKDQEAQDNLEQICLVLEEKDYDAYIRKLCKKYLPFDNVVKALTKKECTLLVKLIGIEAGNYNEQLLLK